MNVLSIDTSTKNFSLAVANNEKILATRSIVLKKVLSSSIIPSIHRILQKANVPLKKLDGFAIGLGPGSFTSLRVGLSTVKALAYALDKPVVGISSLDVIAMNAQREDFPYICTICDAKRDLVYASLYHNRQGQIKRFGKYYLTHIKDVLSKIKGKTLFVGDGIKIFKSDLAKNSKAVLAEEGLWYPQAKNLSQLALLRFKQKKFGNIDTLVPLYLYPKDCQVRR